MTLLQTAEALADVGISVVPVKPDGTKAPASFWKEYQSRRPEPSQIHAWFSAGSFDGLGAVCGEVSGQLEMLELEGRAEHLGSELAQLLADHSAAQLWQRLCSGYLERTPSGGYHWLYRVALPAGERLPGNTHLARRPSTDEELATWKEREFLKATEITDPVHRKRRIEKIEAKRHEDVPQVLIETRGEGGYVVLAPSNGRTHATGRTWVMIAGGPATIPTITVDERDLLHDLARTFDQMPDRAHRSEQHAPVDEKALAPQSTTSEGLRPGDDFEQRTSWDDILVPHGWQRLRPDGDGWLWTRPGKDLRDGPSASTGKDPLRDRLYVFSSSTEFDPETPYTKFSAYALLEHGGDHSAAARSLRHDGFGEQRPSGPALTFSGAGGNAAIVTNEPEVADDERPELNVGNAATMAEWLRDNIGRGRLSGMFLRGSDIVHTPREGEQGYVSLTEEGALDSDGPAQVRAISKSTLASRIQYTYQCFKHVKREKEFVQVDALFPLEAARVATDVPDQLVHLRRLRGVVHSPVLRPDGSLLDQPGYDVAAGLLHLPEDGLTVPPVSDAPSAHEIATAVGWLDKLTGDFNFVTEHDRANYYGMLLSPLLRAMTPPPYKLIAISSPQPGSGKTLLATVGRIIHGGVFRAELPEDDAELRKQITAMLTVTTGPIVHFDNVSGVLRSSTLAGLLTSKEWGDRPLGATEWVGIPNDRLWVITGNNIFLGGDLVRRTIWVTIDPGVPNPELRTGFAIDDLEAWATRHRGDLLWALLTLVRAWVAHGGNRSQARSSDGYATWTETITGILEHAGILGRFGHEESVQQPVGADDDDWRDFLQAIHEQFGDQAFSVKELLDVINDGRDAGLSWMTERPIPLSTLPDQLQDKAIRARTGVAAISRSLGMWLRNRTGRWAGAYTVRQAGERRARERLYRIEVAGPVRHGATGDSGDTAEQSPLSPSGVSDDCGDTSFPLREEKDSVSITYIGGGEQSPQSPLSPATLWPEPRPEGEARP